MPPPQPHSLVIVAPSKTSDVDDWNQPVPGAPVVTPTRGFLYPLDAKEVAQANEAGAVVATHDVVLHPIREIPDAGYIRFEPDDGDRYEIQGHEPYRFGVFPLVVIHTRRVITDSPGAVPS